MAEKKNNAQKQKTVRTTVSMPLSDYEHLELIADSKKVSIAWVVREAIEQYLRSENSSTDSTKN